VFVGVSKNGGERRLAVPEKKAIVKRNTFRASNSHYGDVWKLCRQTFSATLSKSPTCLKTARQSGRRRHANGHNENCCFRVLGIVSRGYRLVSNAEALDLAHKSGSHRGLERMTSQMVHLGFIVSSSNNQTAGPNRNFHPTIKYASPPQIP